MSEQFIYNYKHNRRVRRLKVTIQNKNYRIYSTHIRMNNIVTHIGVYILPNMDIIYKLWTLTVPIIYTGYVTANRIHAWDILQLMQSTH